MQRRQADKSSSGPENKPGAAWPEAAVKTNRPRQEAKTRAEARNIGPAGVAREWPKCKQRRRILAGGKRENITAGIGPAATRRRAWQNNAAKCGSGWPK